MATRDDDEAFIFNRWHESLPLAPLDHHLLPLLDGNRDRDAVVEALANLYRHNVIHIDRDDEAVVDEDATRDVLAAQIDSMPRRLVELKLLRVAPTSSGATPARTAIATRSAR